MLKRILAILTLTGLSVLLIGAASADDGDDVKRHGRSLVGSWIVSATVDDDVLPPFTNLTAFTKDGVVVNSDLDFGTGIGVWKHVRRRQFSLRFVHFVPDILGFPPGSFLTVTATITVRNRGASADGPFVALIENPDIPGVLLPLTGRVEFERITIHDDH